MTEDNIAQMSVPDGNNDNRGTPAIPLDRRVAGGAIFITNSYDRGSDIDLTLNNVIFLSNGAHGYGGAIASREARILGTGCLFENNQSGLEGGAEYGLNQESYYSRERSFPYNVSALGGGGALVRFHRCLQISLSHELRSRGAGSAGGHRGHEQGLFDAEIFRADIFR